MKKFLLFGWYDYEASGGFNDLVNSYDKVDEAIAEALQCKDTGSDKYESAHVVDAATLQIVWVKPD